MNLRSTFKTGVLRRAHAGFAALAALLSLTVAVHAEDCLNTTSTTAVPDFTPCDVAEPQLDLDALLAEHATGAVNANLSDSTPWIIQSSKNVPLTVNSSDMGVSMRTSFATWRDYNVRDAMKTVDTSMPSPATGL